jgi:hypothetical protein
MLTSTTLPSPAFATHSTLPAIVSAVGRLPVWKVSATRCFGTSIRETVPSPRLATYTTSGIVASALGWSPTLYGGPLAAFVFGSIRVTVLSSSFETQTE